MILDTCLASGSYGRVYEARRPGQSEDLAVKIYHYNKHESWERERMVYSNIGNHPNLVSFKCADIHRQGKKISIHTQYSLSLVQFDYTCSLLLEIIIYALLLLLLTILIQPPIRLCGS